MLRSAAEAAALASAGPGSRAAGPFLQVHNPSYDYIQPDLISLLITDHGHAFRPSYVYRQLTEFYSREDF